MDSQTDEGMDRKQEPWASHREHPQNDNPVLLISRPTLQNFIPFSSLLFSRLFIFVSCVFQNPKRVRQKCRTEVVGTDGGVGLATTNQMRVSPRSLSFFGISAFSFLFFFFNGRNTG